MTNNIILNVPLPVDIKYCDNILIMKSFGHNNGVVKI